MSPEENSFLQIKLDILLDMFSETTMKYQIMKKKLDELIVSTGEGYEELQRHLLGE